MGYTHWYKYGIPVVSAESFKAIAADARALREAARDLKGVRSEFVLYSDEGRFVLNGIEGEWGEDFVYRAGSTIKGGGFSGEPKIFWCKTARRPYDAIVAAVWIALKHHFGEDIVLYTEGRLEDPGWSDAFDIYRAAFPDRPAPARFLVSGDEFHGLA